MRCNRLINVLITIIGIAILVGCSPKSIPTNTVTTPVPQTNTPVASVIASSTPVTSPIPDKTVEDVTLLLTISGHIKAVLDVTFSAQGEYLGRKGHKIGRAHV